MRKQMVFVEDEKTQMHAVHVDNIVSLEGVDYTTLYLVDGRKIETYEHRESIIKKMSKADRAAKRSGGGFFFGGIFGG